MEDGLRKSGLRTSIGFLALLMLLSLSSSYAKPSFKNTPLYRHVVKRRNSQPVTLYETKPVESGKKAVAAEKPDDGEVIAAGKVEPAPGVSASQLAKPMRVPAVPSRPANLTDPSMFTREMPLSEAVEILRNSASPRLNIAVLWKDLEVNADIFPDTPIGVDGVSGVSLGRHLKSLVEGVSGGAPEKLGYYVDDGVIVISTVASMPKRMVTRVYDITDLVGQPANYGGMQGMIMSRMVGIMSGGGGYGNSGGGFGSFGGGGYGNSGGGFGNFGGGGFGTSVGFR
jgi:hypothetical protein